MTANQLQEIATNLVNGKLRIENVPFTEIVDTITKKFGRFVPGNSGVFETQYSNVFVRAIEKKDSKLLADTLRLLALNMMVVGAYDEKFETMQMTNAYLRNQMRINNWHNKHDEETKNPFSGRGVVYTVITGDYDSVKEPQVMSDDLDYFLFTNNPNITSDKWNVVMLSNEEQLSNVMLQRKTKILGCDFLKEYDYSIYIDGKFEIVGDVMEYIKKYSKQEAMLCFLHPSRKSVREEAQAIISLGRADADKVNAQVADYCDSGFNDDVGLVETGVIVRNHNSSRLKAVMNDWWEELNRHTHRDQLSFPYVCWKNDFVYDCSDTSLYRNPWFRYWDHQK